jgi:hypothetical protein
VLALHRLAVLDVAAASGLVEADGTIYVVADDELGLARHAADDFRSLGRLALFPGELPDEPAARKQAKPDLEAVVWLPGEGLLVLGSGSRANRQRGVLVRGDQVLPVELAAIHAAIAARLGADVELNLEGATLAGEVLILVQRGNGRGGRSALVHVDRHLRSVLAVFPLDLGAMGGTPLSPTDVCTLPDGKLLLSAAAEASPDAYQDGAVAGSALFVVTPEGAIVARHDLDTREKIEGVAVRADGSILLCVDADDRGKPSALYSARLP